MILRRATADDAGAIARMLGRLAEETGDGDRFATTPESIRADGFGPNPHFHVQIAERENAQGMALYFPHYSTTRAAPGVYVQDLWIAPQARGQRLGRRLLAAVAGHAGQGWGARYLALTTHGHNDAARAFYTRLGFVAHPEDVPMMLDGPAFAALGNTARAVA